MQHVSYVFPHSSLFCGSMRYVISHPVRNVTTDPKLCRYQFFFFSCLLFLHSIQSPLFSRCPHFSLPASFLYHLSLPLSPPVSISPPDAGPQLYGVPVLLPTWAERLCPPGPPPGANDRPVPGRRQPLPLVRPRQQVGRMAAVAARFNHFESRRDLASSRLQKFGRQHRLL